MPAVSVIVPVYKVEKYIHRCVDSILGQTYTDFELILVDDGSPDNCGAICEEYANMDNRVVVIHQENGGLSAARNAGIDWIFANSDSKWLSFIDSDDWVHPKYLEMLISAAEEHNVSVSICGYIETDGEEPEIDAETTQPVLWDTEDFYVSENLSATIACAKLYSKECFNDIRYPVGKLHEDEFVTHKILFQLPTVSAINVPLYFYYINQEGITKSKWNPKRLHVLEAVAQQVCAAEQFGLEKAYQRAINKYIGVLSIHIWQLKEQESALRKKYTPKLRCELRKMLIKYHSLVPFKQSLGVYEAAFPVFMYFYWTVRAQINKLKRKV